MVYAYRLKKKDDAGRVIEGFNIRRTWQFSSDPKADALSKWSTVVFLKADDIKALKAKINEYEKGGKEASSPSSESVPASGLSEKLNGMNLDELKQFAKDNGFPEAEYSTYTRSKLIDYLLLAMPEKN